MQRRRADRIVRGALLVAGALITACFVAGRLAGNPSFPPIWLYQLLPLLGAVTGFARLDVARLARRDRSTTVYLLFCLALLCWGLSGLLYAWQAVAAGVPPAFPSPGDVGFFAGGVVWAAAVWTLYEGVVPDFLTEVEANSWLLSWMALVTLFVLSIAGGADLLEAIKTGGNTLQIASLSYPLLYGFSALMLARLARRRVPPTILDGRRALKIIASGLVLLYLAQVTFETTITFAQRATGSFETYRNDQPAHALYALATFVLSWGVLEYPLARPVVRQQPLAAESTSEPADAGRKS